MNFTISVLFRAIPVIMAAICIGLGLYSWSDASVGTFISGHVVTFLGAICLCLFATASVIIRQLVGCFTLFDKITYPVLGYSAAVITTVYGIALFSNAAAPDHFVAGHVIMGLGFICFCISTVATASIFFKRIPENSNLPWGSQIEHKSFSNFLVFVMVSIPVIMAAIAWAWSLYMIFTGSEFYVFIAGHVLAGLAMICTSLIGLVVSVVKQIQNTYTEFDRRFWPGLVIGMGVLAIVWGVLLLIYDTQGYVIAPAIVMIGLGLVCFSILSKVLLLALVWRQTYALANRIPLLPVGTALACSFAASFLFQASYADTDFFIPAHVLTGLGAICFSLFSIVSILESGTSKKAAPATA